MTTIAYDGFRIARDSRLSTNDIIISDRCDKRVSGDTGIFSALFTVGHLTKARMYADKLRGLGNIEQVLGLEAPDESICVIGVHGTDVWHLMGTHSSKIEELWAWGSGGDFALAAMDFGMTAKEAVEYAGTRDVYTGGNTINYRIKGNA